MKLKPISKVTIYLFTFLISISCNNDDPIEYPVIYPTTLVNETFLFQQYPELEGFYIINSQAQLDRLEEETNGDILFENIQNFDFEQKTIIGTIGESKTEQTKIIFNPVLETEKIIVKWYEVGNEIYPTSNPVQNYLFVSIDKTNKEILFENSDN